ncbi:hypothetical protein PMPD1_1984 [Paramixta manurensis]|uniref:Uncharacterized protein n=1 Tax=Paramixta manurensis TaxID=2740817 RepID=A0A6M8UNP8_9GAMM|nr:hypothetical protein PMPD1_1984 [Erwiniaceae bacterium PD-1]
MIKNNPHTKALITLFHPAKISTLPLLITLFFSAVVSAFDQQDDPEKKLAAVAYFSLGNNGFIAQQSEGEKYLQAIIGSPNAEKKLLNMAKDRHLTPEAHLYIACGLTGHPNVEYDVLFAPYFQQTVSVLKADILRRENFHTVYQWIQKFGCKTIK